MLKLLFFVATVANVILIVYSGTTSTHPADTHSSSGSSSSSSSSSSSGSSGSSSSANSAASSSSSSNSGSNTNSGDSDDEECSSDNDHKCGANEVYEICPEEICRPLSCDQLGFPISCPGQTIDGSCPGKARCICKEGYLFNSKGKCVPTCECPSCGGDDNAEAGCGVNCNRHCSEVGKEPGACTDECHFNACDCKKDYVLDENTGKCVLPKKCTPTCPKHEVFSNCTNGGCDATKCSELGKPVPCIRLKPEACKKGCVCEEGYVRDCNDKCIPKDQCPSCNDDPNAKSGCGVNCGRLCSNYNKGPVSCAAVCNINGCDCKEKYVFDENTKKCVLPKDCTPVCKQHEVYSTCVNGDCDAKNCTQLGKPIPCIKIKPESCIKGCKCEKGYLRASNGTCIPEDQCPNKCTKPNEVYELCPAKCPFRTCGIDDRLLDCIAPLKVGEPDCPPAACRCKGGFFRDDRGNCVEWENCPVCKNPNEEYDACPAPCPAQSCDVDVRLILCKESPQLGDPDCKPGCRCKDTYVRNDKGTCIPRDQCPNQECDDDKCSGANEEYVECAGCSPQTCDSIGKEYSCPAVCKPGCRCKSGFYRNDDNVCIPEDECQCDDDKCSGANEEYVECAGCSPQTCDSIGKEYNCPAICKPGCRCKSGFYRNDDNVCIPEDECPNQGCDDDKCTGANEVYDKCPDCSPQTCESIGKKYNCPLTKKCTPACRCKSGYYRNALNQCISKDKCLKCTGKNEFYACGSACDNECSKLQTQNRTNCPIINVKCNEMCYCKDGYARDCNNDCIPVDQCKENQCKKNEVYEECPDLCQPQTCDEYGTAIACPAKSEAKPACVCKEGYLRNKKGDCIPKEECSCCGGDPNAKPGCGTNCNRHCSDYNKRGIICIALCKDNACECKKDYVLDENTGKCVKPKDCTPTCKAHEVYSNCIQALCRPLNCNEKGKSVPCPILTPDSCKKGCVCEKNYLRSSNGTCVPENECHECKENEVYEECPDLCQPQTCDEYGTAIACPAKSEAKPACVCKEGYLRNKKGVCIPKEECSCCGGDPNAKPGCGTNCNRHCSDYNKRGIICIALCKDNACECKKDYVLDENTGKCVKPKDCTPTCKKNEVYSDCIQGVCRPQLCSEKGESVPCPDIAPGSCKKGCICAENYLRNCNGTCIPECECKDKCKENERFVDCPSALCQPQKCSEAGFPVKCPKSNDRCADEPGCVCDEGYLRNSKGVCIPKEHCPSCRGDKNARPGCGVNCGKLCSTYKVKNPVCTASCDLNGCDCVNDTVYDETKKKCVSPDKCPCTTTTTTTTPKPKCDD